MRILHTADWHLGRIFHGVHLTEDQAYTLEELCVFAKEARPDVVVIAGDLYDRAVPPPDAVALLDEVLGRLVLDVGAAVVAIAGNHDSPERIGFGQRLFEHARLHLVGRAAPPLTRVELGDEHGPVTFHLLPFVEPSAVRERFEDGPVRGGPPASSVEGHGAALRHLVARAAEEIRPGEGRHVVVAHGSVAGCAASESERPLYMGSAVAEASIFAPFAYAALGHHHKAQDLGSATLGPERVRYPGSLLAYSFAEAAAAAGAEPRPEPGPSATLVELGPGAALDGGAHFSREVVPLAVRHPVRVRRGTLQELLAQERSEDFLKLVLTDEGPVLDPMARRQERFPNALMVEQERLAQAGEPGAISVEPDPTPVDDETLFGAFFEEMTGAGLSDAEGAVLRDVLEKVLAAEREAEG